MVRLGLIGAGNIGSAHIQSILEGKCPEIVLSAVADRRASRREWAAARLPQARIYTEGAQLIADRAADAVLIAVPHYQHAELAIAAFGHGQHAMVEKPADVYTLQARRMNAAADFPQAMASRLPPGVDWRRASGRASQASRNSVSSSRSRPTPSSIWS